MAICYPLTLQAGSSAPATSESAVVPQNVLAQLFGSAGVKRDKFSRKAPQFSGHLFNGSPWVITNITVTFFPVEKIVGFEQVESVDMERREAMTQSCTSGLSINVKPAKGSTFEATPLTKAKFSCPEVYAPDGFNYSWSITSAEGYKK